jgi:hypothetical protein
MTVLSAIRKPKILSPDVLLLRKYKLSKAQLAIMAAWGFVLAQLAVPIGSAVYYLGTQRSYSTQGKDGSNVTLVGSVKPGDWWDRLPNHLQALFGNQMFGITSPARPKLWITISHDVRHVIIGFVVGLLVGSVTVGLKRHPRLKPWQMLLSVPAAFLTAIAVATGLIALFTAVGAGDALNKWGITTGNAFIGSWIGSGALLVTVIGIVSGVAAKRVLAPTFSTIQLFSLEDRIGEGRKVPGWFPPNYQRRHDYLIASGHECKSHGKYMGVVLVTAAPFLLLLAAYGTYLLSPIGPAGHAH